MYSTCNFTVLFLVLASLCTTGHGALGWPKWGKTTPPLPTQPELPEASSNSAVFELRNLMSSASSGEEGLPSNSLIKQAQSMASKTNSVQPSCWQKAYKRLLSSCQAIMKSEEKKCRLAYEFTDCFLRMTGWPSPPRCPENSLVRFCTEKFDAHTHKVFLAFFVETSAMCHHLQAEAFNQETTNVINDLKQTGHWLLDTVKDVESLSHEILKDAITHSKHLEEKLTAVETLSQIILSQNEQFDNQLKSTLGTVQAVYDYSAQIKVKQEELTNLHLDMNQAMHVGLKELEKAAQQTHEQLDHISQENEELAKQQIQLADALASNIQRLKESALQSLDELKESQFSAMEETRVSLRGLSDGAQKAQENFNIWQMEMNDRNELLLKGSQAIISAQEAFVSKQGSMLSTLDRMFSLYNNILYESRALKVLVFYGTSMVFVHIFTSTRQISDARALLYIGLCSSMGGELYLMKTYGSVLSNQQLIQTSSNWIRVTFGVFMAMVILYYFLTYRDLSWQNHQMLLEVQQMLNHIMNQRYSATYVAETQLSTTYNPVKAKMKEEADLPEKPKRVSKRTTVSQTAASKGKESRTKRSTEALEQSKEPRTKRSTELRPKQKILSPSG